MSKSVEIFIYIDKCVYINDLRVAGAKPYASESLKSNKYKVSISNLLDSLDIEDIKKYIKQKEFK